MLLLGVAASSYTRFIKSNNCKKLRDIIDGKGARVMKASAREGEALDILPSAAATADLEVGYYVPGEAYKLAATQDTQFAIYATSGKLTSPYGCGNRLVIDEPTIWTAPASGEVTLVVMRAPGYVAPETEAARQRAW